MTDQTNPHPPASPEAGEWEAIAAAPSRHTPARLVDPDDPKHLAALEEHERVLGELEVDEEDRPRSLSGAAGVLFGPDCSQFQGRPDWARVRAAGCIIGGYKVSEGRTYEDPSHDYNRAHTKAHGLVPLAYHFLYYSAEYWSTPGLWAAQAALFCRLVDPAAIHVLDVEAAAPAGRYLGVREWVAEYRRRMPGHRLGVYANRALWQNRSRVPYGPDGLFDFVWHAGIGNGYYTTATGSISTQWAGTGGLVNSFVANRYPTCRLWQITDHAAVPGISGMCDGNAFQGTIAQLRALVTAAPTPPPTGDELDMASLDDVRKIVREELAAHDPVLIGKLDSGDLGRSGPTHGVAWQSGYGAAVHAAEGVDAILENLGTPHPAGVTAGERVADADADFADDDPTV